MSQQRESLNYDQLLRRTWSRLEAGGSPATMFAFLAADAVWKLSWRGE